MSIEYKLLDEINEILEKAPENRHSYFQLQYFLLGKEPTIQGKLWQCIRELKTRKESIESIDVEIEEVKDNIELINIRERIEKAEIFYERKNLEDMLLEEHRIKKRVNQRKRQSLEESMKRLEERRNYLIQEARYLVEAYNELSKIEEVKDYDDFDAQSEYWNEKFTQKLNIKILLGQPIDAELAQSVLALPDESNIKKEFSKYIEGRQVMAKIDNEMRMKIENAKKNIESRQEL